MKHPYTYLLLAMISLVGIAFANEPIKVGVSNQESAKHFRPAPKADDKSVAPADHKSPEDHDNHVSPAEHAAKVASSDVQGPTDDGDTIKQAEFSNENLDGGNWVQKRKYWEEAGAVFGGIRTVHTAMRNKQMSYVEAQNVSDKKVDAAFELLGFKQGELKQLLDSLVDNMQRERTERGDLNVDEREFLATLKEKQKALEGLRKDLSAVADIDATVQQTLKAFTEQLVKAAHLEDTAWKKYQQIGKVLDHKEAHNLYYEIHGLLENMQKIDQYVTHPLWQSVQANIAKIDGQLAKVSASVSALQKLGVDFTHEFIEFRKTDEEREAERRVYEEDQARMALEAKNRKKKAKTWWDTVTGYMPWN